jgi:hypothetical protein
MADAIHKARKSGLVKGARSLGFSAPLEGFTDQEMPKPNKPGKFYEKILPGLGSHP